MSEKVTSGQPRKGRWLKLVGMGAVLLLALAAALYVVGTSAWCLKSVVLPKVSQASGATITIEDASISPFSSVTLSGLRVQTTGTEPLLAAQKVSLRYDLMAILRGDIRVDNVTVDGAAVYIEANADGTSNLDAVTKRPTGSGKAPSQPQAAAAPKLDIKRMALNNARIRYASTQQGGARSEAELSGVNLSVENLRNGQPVRVSLASAMRYSKGAGTNLMELASTLKGALSIGLGADLAPGQVKGEIELAVTRATGALAEAAQLDAELAADLALTEIKSLTLGFSRADAPLGSLSVNGPFDLKRQEGKLNVTVTNIGPALLNLVGARSQTSFGDTHLAASAVVELKSGARVIDAAGTLTGRQFSLKRGDQATPVLDLQAGYDVALDQVKTNAVLRRFSLEVRQADRALLSAALAKPMSLDWGKGAEAVEESSLTVAVEKLNLAEWKAFLGTNIAAGTLSSKVAVNAQKAGKLLDYKVALTLAGLDGRFGSNHVSEAGVELGMRGQVTNFTKVNLTEMTAAFAQGPRRIGSLKGAGQYDTETQDADFEASVESSLAEASSLLSRPDLDLKAGTFKFSGHVTQKNRTPNQTKNPVMDRAVNGLFQIADLTGRVLSNRLDGFEASANVDMEVKDNLADIRKCQGSLRMAGQPGGSFEVSGRYHLTNQTGQVDLKLLDLNQNALGPFVGAALGDKKLETIAINADVSLQADQATGQQVKGGLQVANLVVSDPSGAVPKLPFALGLQLDGGRVKDVVALRQCQLSLSTPQQGTNTVALAGRVDMTKSNAITGALKLSSDRIDLTPWYELLSKPATTKAGSAGTSESSTKPGAVASGSEAEAPIKDLGLRDFTFDVDVRRILLREVEISNLVVKTKIDSPRIEVRPMQLALNGAPVSMGLEVNVGVPGYQYAVDFGTTNTQLAPLVNSFQPESKGKLGGIFSASARMKTAGATGAAATTNLSGNFDLSSTNLNLKIDDVHMPVLKSIINIVLAIPQMVRNPSAVLNTMLGNSQGSAQDKSGWMDEIMKEPISSIAASGEIAGGRIQFRQAALLTPKLQIFPSGAIRLAAVPTNSTMDMPIGLALSRPLMEKAGLAGDTPTNEPFAKLPQFLTMKGTFGKPTAGVDKMALAKMALTSAKPIVENARSALKTWLDGKPSDTNAAAAATNTTTTSTNVSRAVGILNQFLSQPKSDTNAPSTNQTKPFKLF